MAEASTKAFCALKYLRLLAKAEKPESFSSYITVRDFLYGAFESYSKQKHPIPIEERSEAQQLLIKSIPTLQDGLKYINRGLNSDKRIEAQCCLSGLQFIVDDLKKDQADSSLDGLIQSDVVKDIQEYIEETVDAETYGDTEVPNLQNVPATHIWWKNEIES